MSKNGELVERACERVDALLAMDRGSRHQHNLGVIGMRIVIIRVLSNRMAHLRPLVGRIMKAFEASSPWHLREVEG